MRASREDLAPAPNRGNDSSNDRAPPTGDEGGHAECGDARDRHPRVGERAVLALLEAREDQGQAVIGELDGTDGLSDEGLEGVVDALGPVLDGRLAVIAALRRRE